MKKENTRLSLEKMKVAKLTINMNKVTGGSGGPRPNSSLPCLNKTTN
jgi:hypothetical protein